ncbi:hypothetical protein V8F06_006849 [Rhypophila decipiens]
MMNCSCRTAALRLFVRNVTSIQVPADFALARQAARTQCLSTATTSSLLAGLEGQRTTGAFRSLQQSRSLHMTAARPNAEAAVATATSSTTSEINNDSIQSLDNESSIPARKLRKIRRQAEKKKLKQVEEEAKYKARVERRAKAEAKAAKFKGSPGKKKEFMKVTNPATDTTDATDGPESTEAAEVKEEEGQSQKRTRRERKKARTGKQKKVDKASEDQQAESKEKKLKPWEIEKKKKEEERKKQEEEERLKNLQPWQIQKKILKEKFPDGWKPMKKMSPDAMAGIRALHRQFPDTYTTEVLAQKFEMSPEAIRRILKSKWEEKDETPDIDVKRQERWFKRGKSVWTRYAEMGKKPPRKWRAEGIVRDPRFNERRGATHPQHRRSVRAVRESYESRPDGDEGAEEAGARKEWIAKRQQRRNTMARERKLLREASDGLMKGFF